MIGTSKIAVGERMDVLAKEDDLWLVEGSVLIEPTWLHHKNVSLLPVSISNDLPLFVDSDDVSTDMMTHTSKLESAASSRKAIRGTLQKYIIDPSGYYTSDSELQSEGSTTLMTTELTSEILVPPSISGIIDDVIDAESMEVSLDPIDPMYHKTQGFGRHVQSNSYKELSGFPLSPPLSLMSTIGSTPEKFEANEPSSETEPKKRRNNLIFASPSGIFEDDDSYSRSTEEVGGDPRGEGEVEVESSSISKRALLADVEFLTPRPTGSNQYTFSRFPEHT